MCYERGVSWNMLAQMARHQPCVEIILTADTDANKHRCNLAAIKVFHRVGRAGHTLEARHAAKYKKGRKYGARIHARPPGFIINLSISLAAS